MTTQDITYKEFLFLIHILLKINKSHIQQIGKSPNQPSIPEDSKMKTKSSTRQAGIITTVLCAALVSGSSVLAQSEPEEFNKDDLNAVFVRIEMLMKATEESLRYVAPLDIYDDIRSSWQRLEMLASQTEAASQYTVPELLPNHTDEFTYQENSEETGVAGFLSDTKNPLKMVWHLF